MEIIFDKTSLILNRKTSLEKTILDNVSFKLESGGKYTFLGKSDSGKSCIGELINGVLKPTSGTVKIGEFINDGKYIKNINKLRFDIGLISKYNEDMFFKKYVKDELLFAMKYFKYKTKNKALRIVEALKIVGLDESYMNKRIDDLSLSESLKIKMASVLIYNPKVIILDEPTLHLNYKEKRELIRILNFINEKYKKTIIVLSRDVNFIYEFKSKVFIMHKGKVIDEEDVLVKEEVLNKYDLIAPDIVKFTNLAKKQGANLKIYTDILDLIKGVCNDVL